MDWIALVHGALVAIVFVVLAFGLMRWFGRNL